MFPKLTTKSCFIPKTKRWQDFFSTMNFILLQNIEPLNPQGGLLKLKKRFSCLKTKNNIQIP